MRFTLFLGLSMDTLVIGKVILTPLQLTSDLNCSVWILVSRNLTSMNRGSGIVAYN